MDDAQTPSDWDTSAQAWISIQGTEGDWGRRHVLDRPMMDRGTRWTFDRALDIGCGEGRFCRMMKAAGLDAVGVDPTERFVEQARTLDETGEYRVGLAEALVFEDAHFDLAVFYLTLCDIADFQVAIREAVRVLRPGGILLIANLQPFNTCATAQGWTREADGSRRFSIDHYFDERTEWIAWSGVRVRNWHRPLEAYMKAFLDAGLSLTHFAEPLPQGVTGEKADRYRRVPNFLIMEWRKPG